MPWMRTRVLSCWGQLRFRLWLFLGGIVSLKRQVWDSDTTGVPEGIADRLRVAQASLVTIAHIFR